MIEIPLWLLPLAIVAGCAVGYLLGRTDYPAPEDIADAMAEALEQRIPPIVAEAVRSGAPIQVHVSAEDVEHAVYRFNGPRVH